MTYLALTLGPIYRTLSEARKTRALWGGSYFFSYVLRELVELLKTDPRYKIKGEFLIPFYDDELSKESLYGAGKFHDRFIFRSEPGDFELVEAAIDHLLGRIADDIYGHIANTKVQPSKTDPTKVKEFLKGYLQFYFIEKEVKEGENIVYSLYPLLDVLELRETLIHDDGGNYLMKFLWRVNKLKNNQHSFLAENAFNGKDNNDKSFDSLVEITTRGLSRIVLEPDKADIYDELATEYIWQYQKSDDQDFDTKQPDKEDETDQQENFLLELKASFGKDFFRAYHKYVAVIYADGDHVGELLKAIGKQKNQEKELQAFSRKLLDFDTEAEKIIHRYGGAPVYLGGEDILAFVPLACISEMEEGKPQVLDTVFDLIGDLDDEFDKHFNGEKDRLNLPKKPTLSYGISIIYYKSPLYESMEMAHKLLKDHAKSEAKTNGNKNAIALHFQKHSGQFFEALILKENQQSYGKIRRLVTDFTKGSFDKIGNEQKQKILASFAHRLKDPLFKASLELVATAPARLGHFFQNTFNEGIHKSEEGKAFLKETQDLILSVCQEYGKTENAFKMIYTTLRLIHFITSTDEKE